MGEKQIYRKPNNAYSYSKFKVAPHREPIIDMIKSNAVSAISAQTGSGKTLFVPYALAQTGEKVRVALPFTVSARSAWEFQRRYSKLRVGFAAARDVKYSMNDQIVYATTGHFVVKLLNIIKRAMFGTAALSADMFAFLGTVFMVDEVHSGTVQTTFLIGLLNYLRTVLGSSFKTHIVFTSATLNHLDVARHFQDFPTYEVDLSRLPITHVYLAPEQERDPRNLKDPPTEEIITIIRQELDKMSGRPDMWHIIVFRPGVQEVEDLVQNLEIRFNNTEITVIPAYSELSQDDLQLMFEDYGMPKVIVGTNIIESSITVDNVGAIINDGLVKRVYTNDTGGQKLVTSIISCAEETQRAGRTARTRPGTAYHLYTQTYRETNMIQHHPPEIDRIPIHNVVLSCIDSGLVPKDILGISESRQQQAIDTLTYMEMIAPPSDSGSGLGTVTSAGNFVSHVNLGIYNAYMIYIAINQYQNGPWAGDELVLRSAVVLAVMLEIYGPPLYYVPRRTRGQDNAEYQSVRMAHIEKYFDRFMGKTELDTLLNTYWTMVSEIQTDSIDGAEGIDRYAPYKRWAVNNSINNKKLREFVNTLGPVMDAVADHLNKPELLDDVYPPTPEEQLEVNDAVLDLFKQAYAKNVFRLTGRRQYTDERGITYSHAAKHYCLEHTLDSAVIAAQIMEIQDDPSRPTRRVIGLSVPVETGSGSGSDSDSDTL